MPVAKRMLGSIIGSVTDVAAALMKLNKAVSGFVPVITVGIIIAAIEARAHIVPTMSVGLSTFILLLMILLLFAEV